MTRARSFVLLIKLNDHLVSPLESCHRLSEELFVELKKSRVIILHLGLFLRTGQSNSMPIYV
jgi:hypothetical protein